MLTLVKKTNHLRQILGTSQKIAPFRSLVMSPTPRYQFCLDQTSFSLLNIELLGSEDHKILNVYFHLNILEDMMITQKFVNFLASFGQDCSILRRADAMKIIDKGLLR